MALDLESYNHRTLELEVSSEIYISKFFSFLFFKVYLFILRERECEQGRVRERRGREFQAGSSLSAPASDVRLEPVN